MKRLFERKKEAGFSLVEMMIVLAILGVVMAAMYSMFTHQQKSYSVQDHVSMMQQNVRVGLDYLVKDIRMAGYIPEGIPFDASDAHPFPRLKNRLPVRMFPVSSLPMALPSRLSRPLPLRSPFRRILTMMP